MNRSVIPGISPQSFQRHALHDGERAWPETNCYVDLWIGVLHALKREPLASLAFTLGADFEGDQWTFYKPPHQDLFELYGLEVQELNLWRELEAHVVEQVTRGRMVLAEVDAFYLPDTSGTDYGTKHTKTTVGIQAIDTGLGRLEYFHNAGFFELSGADYRGIFGAATAAVLPPYVEFVKFARGPAMEGPALVERSLILLQQHLRRAPARNPFPDFAERFCSDVERLQRGELPDYHLYAFATLRQLGSAFDLAAQYLAWLERNGEHDLKATALECQTLSSTAKALILKTARAVATKKPTDFSGMLSALAAGWDAALPPLKDRYIR